MLQNAGAGAAVLAILVPLLTGWTESEIFITRFWIYNDWISNTSIHVYNLFEV